MLPCGWLPLDVDTFAMDNGQTVKEGVGRTYAGVDGYCPLAAYLGRYGFCLELALRPGVQHSAKETVFNLQRVIPIAQRLSASGPKAPLLARLDSGFDAAALMAGIESCNQNRTTGLPQVDWLIERTIDAKGQVLIAPDYTLEGWTTTLPKEQFDAQAIIDLYADHGTHEQFHSEFKTDLERLPSGKFDTNYLVCQLAALAMNILRLMGQRGLLGEDAPLRHADRVVLMNAGKIEQVGSPQEVWDHPASPFVYGFLGDVNLFHGRAHEGEVHFEGLHIDSPEHADAQNAKAFAYVRPHDLDVQRYAPGAQGIVEQLERARVIGPIARLELIPVEDHKQTDNLSADSLIEVQMTAQQFRELGLKEGETLVLTPRKARVFVES